MLTKSQQLKLILLTSHEKYGQLLADAIETWKYSKPIKEEFGDFERGCCLLGAANLFSPDATCSLIENICQKYNIDIKSNIILHLIEGFDNEKYYYYNFDMSEAWQFANKVSNIVFNE